MTVSTVLWFVGFALMMGSFAFLFGRGDDHQQPRISVDTREPDWVPTRRRRPK
jgi:hypothetical protein